ncbi:hydrogenase-4 component E [Siccirubricoccus sp. KC 17139]|uniref:Hydrogenase-4 component E n=1 Tax=Siccirubricoccus soli TaxID=2899147 RepID=A0ABT1DDX2_9PROT|nr:hydrogenase-4 component E [Siccirubricoccus soli]MCO6419175.1 hydrogenase-4 component E [Siccirubricoccus soli]MCP2685310.1 hydrogenase-4 component E [Siccirubricoccus soli]
MTFGQLPYDVAHLLGGCMLLLSFVLLYQRGVAAVVNIFAAQGAVLAAAAAWQGFVQGAPQLYLTALIAFAAKAVLIPLALRILIRRLDLHRNVEPAFGIGPSMIAGVALVALAILVVLPITAGSRAIAREDLALALSVVLLGMLMMITRRNAILQVVGLMSLENGLILAAVGVAGMPLVVELSTAALVMLLLVVAGVFVFQIRERFDTVDTALLDPHRGERP